MLSKAELETWLKAKRWGASQAALHLHVNVRTVQRWLAGDRRIPPWLETVIELDANLKDRKPNGPRHPRR